MAFGAVVRALARTLPILTQDAHTVGLLNPPAHAVAEFYRMQNGLLTLLEPGGRYYVTERKDAANLRLL
jgi:hypothetical protein